MQITVYGLQDFAGIPDQTLGLPFTGRPAENAISAQKKSKGKFEKTHPSGPAGLYNIYIYINNLFAYIYILIYYEYII